jgi:hypothetical protein
MSPKKFRKRYILYLLIVIALVSILIMVRYFSNKNSLLDSLNSPRYLGQLHKVIAPADRIVIRFGSLGPPVEVDRCKVLFEVTDPAEIREVYDNIQFEENQSRRNCACWGWPVIDWYEKDNRLAMTAVKHGKAIRWAQMSYDLELTETSQQWLKAWMAKKDVDLDYF